MKPKTKRLTYIVVLGFFLGGVGLIVLGTLNDQLMFFVTPSDLVKSFKQLPKQVRLGGVVERGSIVKVEESHTTEFVVTDLDHKIKVRYTGPLPDLFREGQGVVIEGSLQPPALFVATKLLAKHDENYMPKEVSEVLKSRGEWRPEEKK
jgi:cytochrome c-type biogenesis protein CcmE